MGKVKKINKREGNMRKVFTKIFAIVLLGLVLSVSSIFILSDRRISFAPGEPKSSEELDKNNLKDKTSNNKTSNDDQDKEFEDSGKDINSNENTEPKENSETGENTETEEDTQLSVKISFAGDVLLASGVESLIEQKGTEFIISDVKHIFEESDISMVNLECAISEIGTKAPDKQFTFRAKPQTLDVLKFSKMDIVSLANNHTLDFGVEALLDTFQNLRDYGIKYAGAGMNMDEAARPVFIEENGIKIAFIASSRVIPVVSWTAGENTPGLAVTYDPKRTLEEIAFAKKQADIVVVYVHWGEERKEMPLDYQKNMARAYIDEGADIVVGAHPHVLQGLEFYKGKLIAYSLGNFIFTDSRKNTMVLQVEVNKSGVEGVRIIPCRIENLRPVLIKDEEERAKLIEKVESLSFDVEIDMDGFVNFKQTEF